MALHMIMLPTFTAVLSLRTPFQLVSFGEEQQAW